MPRFSFRRVIVVGYTFAGAAPVLDGRGLPVRQVAGTFRMMVAFWVPQPEPFRRRPVGSHAEFLKAEVSKVAAAAGEILPNLFDAPSTLNDYVARYRLHDRVMHDSIPAGFTMVSDASATELEALRAGVIEEQLQDFVFPRQPTADELRSATLPHWEVRTNASLGYLPNPSAAREERGRVSLAFEAVGSNGSNT